jgi:MarR family transcriptional regulator, 2-MHQ and catechol-resistance regulon repressor
MRFDHRLTGLDSHAYSCHMQLSGRKPLPADPDRALAADGMALQTALADLVRIYQFRDRDRICCHDVSVTQCYALEQLVLHGPQRLNTLAERLRLDKSTASRVVAALERKQYAARFADADDGRAVALTATASGRRLHRRIRDDLAREHEKLMADLAPEVRHAAIQVISRLARAAELRFRRPQADGSTRR